MQASPAVQLGQYVHRAGGAEVDCFSTNPFETSIVIRSFTTSLRMASFSTPLVRLPEDVSSSRASVKSTFTRPPTTTRWTTRSDSPFMSAARFVNVRREVLSFEPFGDLERFRRFLIESPSDIILSLLEPRAGLVTGSKSTAIARGSEAGGFWYSVSMAIAEALGRSETPLMAVENSLFWGIPPEAFLGLPGSLLGSVHGTTTLCRWVSALASAWAAVKQSHEIKWVRKASRSSCTF